MVAIRFMDKNAEASDGEAKHADDSSTSEQRLNSGPSDKEKAIPVTSGGEGEDKNAEASDDEGAAPQLWSLGQGEGNPCHHRWRGRG